MLYGKYDQTVDIEEIKTPLADYHLSYTSYQYENSANNIFEGYDKEKTARDVINILKVFNSNE